MTATQVDDPFAGGTATPSLSFKDMPVGTTYTGVVVEIPKMVQAKDFDTGNAAFWPDGNPKMTVVTRLRVDGEERNLWAPKPSAMFGAIAAAQQAAGSTIAVGGKISVTYTGDKPNEKNPRLNPAKQYTVTYEPPNAFAATEQGPVNTGTGEIQSPAPSAGPTPEQLAAVKAAGLDPATVFPGYTG